MKGYFSSLILILGVALFMISGCQKLDLEVEVPSCIEKEIRKIQRDKLRNPPAQVWKWEDNRN